jgi:hypothetical protein
MVGCCERKMAPTIVNNRICFARFLRCRREVDVSFVVRVTFLGTRIVLPVHLIHWALPLFVTVENILSCDTLLRRLNLTAYIKSIHIGYTELIFRQIFTPRFRAEFLLLPLRRRGLVVVYCISSWLNGWVRARWGPCMITGLIIFSQNVQSTFVLVL